MSPATYRRLLVLYPRDFRERYGDDLVQALEELAVELGPRRARRRVALDLAVTVPRYRLESVMHNRHQATVLTAAIVLLAALGLLSVPAGLPQGLILLPTAIVLGITQRSRLARSLDVDRGDNPRRRRLVIAAVLTALLPAVYLASLPILGDDWGTDAVVAFGIWFAILLAAAGYFIAGISTPKQSLSAG